MPQPIIISFEEEGSAEVEKDMRAMAVALGKLTKAEADAIKPTAELIRKSRELNDATQSGKKSLDEQTQAYADLARASQDAVKGNQEISDAQQNTADSIKEATVEQKAFGDHVSSARTAMGKLSFAAAAVAGGIKIATDAAKDFASAVEDTPELFDSRQVKIAEDYNTQITLLSVGLAKQKEPFAVAITGWAKVGNTLLIADEAYKAVFRATGDVAEAQRAHHRVLTEGTTRFAEIEAATRSSDRAMLAYAASAGETSIAIKELTEVSFGELLHLTEKVGKEADRLAEKEAALREQFDLGKISLDEMNIALNENALEFEESTNRRILKRAEEILAADTLSEEEELALLAQGEAMGLWTEDYVTKAATIISTSKQIADGITADLARIPARTTTDIIIRTLRQEIIQPVVRLTGAGPGFAAGVSDFIVPPGYQNDAFPMRVSSGERVNVETKPQQSQGGSKDETNKLLKQLIDKEAINVDMLTIAFRDAMLIGAQ